MLRFGRKAKFVVEYTVDLDGVPGWGYQPEDWIKLATDSVSRQTHYNTSFEVKSVEVIPATAAKSQ